MPNNNNKQSQPIVYATVEEVRAAAAALPGKTLAALYYSASKHLAGTGLSEAEDLFSETFARYLQGTRRWPLHIPFDVCLHVAMEGVASDQRKLHANSRRAPLPEEEPAGSGPALRGSGPSALELLAEKRRVELAWAAMEAALPDLADDPAALRLLEGWLGGEDPGDSRKESGLGEAAYDAARKRALRAVRKRTGAARV